MKPLLLLLVWLVVWSPSAFCEEPYTYEGTVENIHFNDYSGICQEFSEQESPLIAKICLGSIKIKYKLNPLMGEPTENYAVAWTIDPRIYLHSGEVKPIDKMPLAVQNAFGELVPGSPTTFIIMANYQQKTRHQGWLTYQVYFRFDGGYLAKSGAGYSYNTTGSPNWGEFILGDLINENFLPPDEAKEAFKALKKDSFAFAGVKNLTFAGIPGLDAALQSESTYPLTIQVISNGTIQPSSPHIRILNIQPPYRAGIKLKAGRYHIRVDCDGFQPTEQWITLDARHTAFEISLAKALTAEADDLETMLAKTEDPDSVSSKTPALFDTPSSQNGDSLEDLLENTEKVKLELDPLPQSTRENVITVSGKVKNVSSIDSSSVTFNVNGLEQPVYLNGDGSFSNKVVLFNGDNTIDIAYKSAAKNAYTRVTVKSTTPPVKARFTLTWDSVNSDMDLHVRGPQDQHCFYEHKQTANMMLDVDNTKRYGPENISVKLEQSPGTYDVYVKHYKGNAGNVTLYVYLDNRLVATKKAYLSNNDNWHAYTLTID